MGKDKVRYFVVKANAQGSVRCYWQPSAQLEAEGWRTRRLPDPPEAFAHLSLEEQTAEARRQALALNAQLDAWYKARKNGEAPKPNAGKAPHASGEAPKANAGKAARGTVAALIAAYRGSEFFREEISENTRRQYGRALDYLAQWLGPVPVRAVFTKDVRDRYKKLAEKAPAQAHAIMRVGRACFGKAHLLFYPHDPEYIAEGANPFAKLDLAGGENKAVIYARAPIEWLIAAADMIERPSIGDAIEFGYWFGQNPSDAIELPANLLEKSPLEIRRNKTGARCILPIARVPELVERIVAGQERRKSLKVQPVTWLYNEGTGRAYKRDHFTHCVSVVRDVAYSLAAAAGDACMAQAIAGFQYAKLRHTGITAFAGAGATKYEIHNIMGHSLATIDAVLEHHYLAPNVAAAEIAIDKRVKGEGR